ncbi:MAG: SusD/RagB family nutrient-binding outer membrane lipoprotein [Thermoflavifilum sp.]|nr:SusD/RagB family nutrient-binding outer membrane lipoprotein [Thermoflavifilum sp.]
MKKIFIAAIFLTGVLGACTKNMYELNKNPKQPENVPGEGLFSNAQKSFTDLMTTPNVNLNIFELIVQFWAEITYPQESQYDLGGRNIPQNWWTTLYRDVIKDYDQAKVLIRQEDAFSPADQKVKANKLAITEICEAYAFSVVLNTFGNIPYTEALDPENTTPKFDDAKTVYYALLDSLDKAIQTLDPNYESFGSNDLLYGGDVSKWIKFANSLKLKLGLLIADVDPAKAKSVVESAAPNVFQSNDDNALFQYLSAPPNVNPIWTNLVQSNRNDFVPAKTLVDTMNALNDPRLPFYFTRDPNNGYSGGIPGAGNTYANFSHPSDKTKAPDFPSLWMDYAEVEFLLAEAVERGFNVGGTAKQHYDNAVTASIEYWGGTSADALTYLAQPSVNYLTAPGDWKYKIGFQSWIALYLRGWDAWTQWRKLDYPALQKAQNALTDIPVRYTYPINEQTLNKDNYVQASQAIGGDDVTTKLFWDKY